MSNLPDLSCLNDIERAILTLLAQGHTTKSIASELGRSEGSVNERLRDARRKTGVGSSRELARLLRSRENRDQRIGVATPSQPEQSPPRVPLPARVQGKVLLMTISIAALATAAVLALHASNQRATPTPLFPPASTTVPPITGTDVDRSAAQTRAVFAAQARDPTWADRMEDLLRRRYAAIQGVDVTELRITCRTTLCEVRGSSVIGIGAATGKRAVDALASPALRNALVGQGLHADVTDMRSEGRDDGKAFRFEFQHYWQRTDGT